MSVYRFLVMPALLLVVLIAACAQPSNATQAPAAGTVTPRATPHAQGLTLAVIGASDAFGVGTDNPETQGWPPVLAQRLGTTVHLVNLGIPGATVAQALREEAPIAIDSAPRIIIVWLALNDFANGTPLETYRRDLATLLTLLSGQTPATLFVANLPDLTHVPYFAKQNPAVLATRLTNWNDTIAQVTNEHGALLVDLYADWHELATHPDYLSADGLHPSDEGASRLADIFAAQVGPVAQKLAAQAGQT